MTLADETVDFDVNPHVNAVLAMQIGPAAAHLLTDRRVQERASPRQQSHFETQRANACGHFRADETSANHDDASPSIELGTDGQAVIDRAESQHAIGHAATGPLAYDGAAG